MLYADLLLFNGKLISLQPCDPKATALAVREGRIVAVGSDRDAMAMAGTETERIDLRGKTVVPGFCDAHIHLAWLGMGLLRQVDLSGSRSLSELMDRLASHADSTAFEWVQGMGFDPERMQTPAWPTRNDLDKISTTRPIIVTRICGHAAVVNSAALRRVGSAGLSGGNCESGRFTEEQIAPFLSLIPPLSDREMEEAILRASKLALQTGVTSVGTLLDGSMAGAQMRAFQRLNRRAALPLRVTAMPPARAIDGLFGNGIATGFGDSMLRFGGAKFFSDGSLGARTALLSAPYSDGDELADSGTRIYEPDVLKALARDAAEKGFQIVVHAIGDLAIDESISAIQYALGPGTTNEMARHRIEHASVLSPRSLDAMAQTGILAVVQPQFVVSDGWVAERLGPPRVGWAYPFRKMRDAGIRLALSSDSPIERVDAFSCLHAAVNRAPWSPEGGLTVVEALHDYCLGGAYSLFAETETGSLEVGKLADFVVLSDDITRIDAARIGGVVAEQVFVGGRESVPR